MIYLVRALRSTAVIPVTASVVAIAAVAVTPIIPVPAVITAFSIVAVAAIVVPIPYRNNGTASKQGGQGRKNEKTFHGGFPCFEMIGPNSGATQVIAST
jgi:membrane protein implicated in regulation of membrane protease activity